MTQRNVRGAYVNFTHDRAADWDWLRKWEPNVIRYMGQGSINDPNSFDVNRVKRIHETCPNSNILLRCWEVDDNNFKAHDAMVQDPRGTAEHQVDWWAKVFDRATAVGVPRNLLMAGLNNETGPEKDASLYPYTEFALQFATPRAVRLGVLVFSVGRPSLAGESQYDIAYFSQLDNAILANNGAVLLHQYMQPEGMYAVWTDDQGNERKDWTYLMGRDLRWQIQSPIIIGEWGLDGILYNRHPDPVYGNSGWRNFKAEWPPQRYADEYVECVRQANDNVIGICPFLSDFSDHKWQSFDVLDAYEEFLARKDLCVRDIPDTKPVDVHIPSVGTGKPTNLYVLAPLGANVRNEPAGEVVLTAIPYGERVQAIGTRSNWVQVRYGDIQGWVRSDLVGPLSPEPLPAPTTGEGPTPVEKPQPSDKWARSIAWVLEKEGGLSVNPEDHGNWTGGRKGQGELKGTNWGISAASYPTLDIRNLTKAQAIAIYERDYWIPSGASSMAWPLCLLVLDSSVLHGVGAATKWLKEVGPNPYAFASKRLHVYTKSDNGDTFWRGWINRVGDLLEEMGKP